MLFYSNEHEPVHVHGKCRGRETRAEFVIVNGQVTRIIYRPVRGRRPLESAQQRDFEVLVEHYAQEIVQKWVNYFVLHKPIQPVEITRRIR